MLIAAIIVGLGFANVIPGFHLSSPSTAPGASSKYPAPQYAVTFSETGLSSGTSWSVTLGTMQTSTGSAITFQETNGTYAYTLGSVTGYTAGSSRGNVTVSGAPTSVPITFSPSSSTGGPSYGVTFTQTGLPSGTPWSVTVGSQAVHSTGASLSFSEPNGSYTYTVGPPAGYRVTPPSAAFSVHGVPVSIALTFSPIGSYTVGFEESGLPAGTSWTVVLAGSSQSGSGVRINFPEPNGSYSYSIGNVVQGGATYAPTPSSGTVAVSGGSVSVLVQFAIVTGTGGNPAYPVTITQTGLPGNVTWEAAVVYGNYSSTATAISTPFGFQLAEGSSQTFEVPNGTYTWSAFASSAQQYTESPLTGHLTVRGLPLTATVTFLSVNTSSPTLYPVTFQEQGLPSGASWGVSMNGTVKMGTAGAKITVLAPNGTYLPTFSAPAGFEGFPPTSVAVAAAPIDDNVTFVYVYSATFDLSGSLWGQVNWTLDLTDHTNATFSTTLAEYRQTTPISESLPNGTYTYMVQAIGYSGSAGNFTIAGLAPTATLTIHALANFSVTFTGTGLPSTSVWAIEVWQNTPGPSSLFGGPLALAGYALGGTSSKITFSVSDGNYSWILLFAGTSGSLVSNYLGSPMSGGFAVAGSAVRLSVSFTSAPGTHLVLIEGETLPGAAPLANLTSWGVTVNGVTFTTSGQMLVLGEPDGSFSYTVNAPTGYSALPLGGTLTINVSNTATSGILGALIILGFYTGPLTPLGAAGPGAVVSLLAGHVPGPGALPPTAVPRTIVRAAPLVKYG